MAELAVTAGNVLKSSGGSFTTGTAAATITQGKAVYVLVDGTIGLADSNAAAPANTVAGYSITSAAAGQPILYVTADPALVTGATHTVGAVCYLSSDTAGGITETYADIDAASIVIVLGVAVTASTLNFHPLVGGAKP